MNKLTKSERMYITRFHKHYTPIYLTSEINDNREIDGKPKITIDDVEKFIELNFE